MAIAQEVVNLPSDAESSLQLPSDVEPIDADMNGEKKMRSSSVANKDALPLWKNPRT